MQLRTDGQRLNDWLTELSGIGATPDGGVTRFALTDADWAARDWLVHQASRHGLAHRLDAAGNLFIYVPEWQGKPVLLAGSHLDTVPNGGRFDGALGVLAALASLIELRQSALPLQQAVEVAVWTEEEGSRFPGGLVGSRAFIGELPAAELAGADADGISLAAALRNRGLDPDQALRLSEQRGDLAGYLELHIEQGGVLERSGLQIGVVTGIVGIRRYDVVVNGQANHAGTTPMALRRDALTAAAEMVLWTEQTLRTRPNSQAVATVGKLTVHPGGVNVVPGRVEFALEVRDIDSAVMDQLAEQLLSGFERVAANRELRLHWQQSANVIPAPLHPAMRQAVLKAAEALGCCFIEMPSGAGHDAQHLAHVCPTGMIFVPSRGGISHSPHEYTSPADCARGAEVLLNALYNLAR